MHALKNLCVAFLAISILYLVPLPCRAETITSYIIVVRQINPDGELNAIDCADGEKSCSLEIKLSSERDARLKVGVLITSGEAYFKFKKGREPLEGNNLRYFYIPLGGDQPIQKKITLFSASQIDDKTRDTLHQSPVLKYSHDTIADIEITIVPRKNRG
ncbi:MAG: hypothetical protein GC185_06715 [Alphaproteobacteria bacterium]|nr:hypothetical protein [Alphaproteobacteria bacterium]